MLTNNQNQFNLTDEILEAAKLLKEEQELIGDEKEIANLISHWLCEQLEEIEWHYLNHNPLKKKVFHLELETEKLAGELNTTSSAA